MDALETELKFAVEPETELPPLSSVRYGPSETFTMNAQYYDTPDFLLTRSKVATVRRREGGADQGWHVKLSLSSDQRVEVHAPLASPVLPPELRGRIAQAVGTAPLVPVARLTTRRTETDLLGADGDVWGKLCHDEVSADARGHRSAWAELEVETVAADQHWLATVAAEFAAAGIPRAGHSSKYGKAMEPLLTEGPRPATAGSVVLAYLQDEIGVLQAYAGDVRENAADAVHRSRVATRRLRSALRTFAPVFLPLDSVRRELKWHAEKLGAARDAEVLQESLRDVLDRSPSGRVPQAAEKRIFDSLDDSHAQAHAELVVSMSTARYTDLCLALIDLIVSPPFSALAAGDPALLVGLAAASTSRVAKPARRAMREENDLAAWHRVRKLAKGARYAHEALIGPCGDDARQAAASWETVTEALGRVQDARMGRERLGQVAHDAERAGEATTAYDELAALAGAAGATALDEAKGDLAAALAARPL